MTCYNIPKRRNNVIFNDQSMQFNAWRETILSFYDNFYGQSYLMEKKIQLSKCKFQTSFYVLKRRRIIKNVFRQKLLSRNWVFATVVISIISLNFIPLNFYFRNIRECGLWDNMNIKQDLDFLECISNCDLKTYSALFSK